jgi:hypothetical protein
MASEDPAWLACRPGLAVSQPYETPRFLFGTATEARDFEWELMRRYLEQ